MKTLGSFLIFIAVVFAVIWIWQGVFANYQWENSVLSNWSLSDKSSTLEAKSLYMDKFVQALQSAHLADNDALLYKTADNNCQNNIDAVSTLRDRLNQIKGMDETSFQYQQAIQQITSQEQGEADTMISTLNGCWMKTNYYLLWNPWVVLLGIFFILGFLGIGIGLIATDY